METKHTHTRNKIGPSTKRKTYSYDISNQTGPFPFTETKRLRHQTSSEVRICVLVRCELLCVPGRRQRNKKERRGERRGERERERERKREKEREREREREEEIRKGSVRPNLGVPFFIDGKFFLVCRSLADIVM